MHLMEKIFEFISQHKEVSLATVNESGKPSVRIFQIMLNDSANKMLYFATSPQKETYRQLLNNPDIEILAYSGNISVRISGTVIFDVPDKICQKIYAKNQVLQRLYQQYTDLVYFKLIIKKADYYNLNPTPPILESFVL